MARLLSQMNREIELGNGTDLNLLLAWLGNNFPPQDVLADDNALQAVLLTSVSHVPKPQRRNEQKARQADAGNDKSHLGKRKQEVRNHDTYAGESSMLDHILRSLNDVKSEVGGFRKLLVDHGFTQEDPR
jgi:hypothetical protein